MTDGRECGDGAWRKKEGRVRWVLAVISFVGVRPRLEGVGPKAYDWLSLGSSGEG